MNCAMYSIEEVDQLINNGKRLFIAADEKVLTSLPRGNWVGGSIPYFMADEGGLISKDRAFVNILPDYITDTRIVSYDESTIRNVYVDGSKNGFSFIVLPATSPTHLTFANNAPGYEGFAHSPLVGWVSGVHLSDLGKIAPTTINGETGAVSNKNAIVMHIELPKDRFCEIGILNIFSQGQGDKLEFLETGFSAKEVLVNGQKTNFASYLLANKADVRLPIVANYFGENINVSIQSIDEANQVVNFYAPVFPDIEYRQAEPIENYVQEFTSRIPNNSETIVFSCNCILNFLYSELEGKKTSGILGPITFGEVAYQLLNQTLVYIMIK